MICPIDTCAKPRMGHPTSTGGWTGPLLCSMHYSRKNRHGNPLYENERHAFVEDVLAGEPTDDCIMWPTERSSFGNQGGYPYAKFLGSYHRINVYVCERTIGPRPEGMQSCHSCNKPLCINPRHLRWCTPKENAADRVLAGSQSGELGSRALLTNRQAMDIKKRRLAGELGVSLAREFNVSPSTISKLHCGINWRSLGANLRAQV